MVLVRDGIGQPGPHTVIPDLGHWVLHNTVIVKGHDCHVGIERQVIADELLSRFVDPLPLAMGIRIIPSDLQNS